MQRYILLFFLLIQVFILDAQQVLYRHFTVEDGLPSLTIYQITQDNEGYIWMASDKGVGKFDGYQFQNFTIQDGIPANDIKELFIDSKNRIWLISRGNSIAFIQNNRIRHLKTDKGFIEIKTKGIHEFDNTIWIDTEQGLFFYKDNQLEAFKMPNENWEFLGIDEKGVKWFYDENALLFPEGDVNQAIQIPLDTSESLDSRIFQWENGMLYFETDANLYFFKDSLQPVNLFSGLQIGQQQPPFLVARRSIRHFNEHRELELDYQHKGDFRLHGAFQDREGNWWFNTLNDGVFLLTANAQLSKTYNIQSGLDDPIVTATTKDKTGNIFIGTENGDLYIIENGNPYPTNFPIANARKMNILLADDEFLYIGSHQGLHLINRENFVFPMFGFGIISGMTTADCSPPNCVIEKTEKNFFIKGDFSPVNDIFKIQNRLLVATEHGVWELTLDDASAFIGRQLSEYPTQTVVALNNEIWVGRKDGLFKINANSPQKIKTSQTTKPLLASPINHLAIGKNNDLWIGTDGYGIAHYSNNQFKAIPNSERDIVEKIVVDELQTWVATNNGVKRIKLLGKKYSVRNLKVADGLPTQETNTIFTDKKSIYVGTNRGFTIFNKIRLSNNKSKPPLYITNIKVNNQDVAPKDNMILSYNRNNISIQYVGISFKSNRELSYFYKMDGIDDDWQPAQLTELSFRGLKAGNYTFHIKAIDVDGMESDEQTMSFAVQPPFWQRTWFQLLMFALALTGIYFFIQWRTGLIERREQEKLKTQQEKADLEVKVAQEKAEIERIENELAKSKLETLQAQMNPHFAYNALTSIQKFILKKDNKTANKYLVKFARLMRLFLESSKESFVSLEREIELLQLYIEMEQLRFKDKFEVEYAINPMVNTLEVPIPSMLLQIFVENAINHGLVYKEGNGKLKFAVEQHDNEVWCIVEDDGIGRKKAQEIKKQTTGAYKSLGMKISRERIKYLNITENTQVHIQIDDEILGEGNGGTRVIVKIV